ncbi:ABC transporter [Candidatus Mycoplasma haematolamae str. Purdue]|uniref:ABC transporter n=1 Tax=Mycoplasma haematolamae (strain Purdue) TaxID=1212765 RepID=I7C7G9_MYCHA|nr:hypothetical protein [Candidatus Mycoplasma haematolamae]AFO52482.1 ABC transporter [Candidatus Mycoplasma haematolamae str. Purdue]
MFFLNKKMILLTLLSSGIPSVSVLSSAELETGYKIMVNYNGQADLLLSLQIQPDYYPYQFKQVALYDYLTDINKYLVVDEHTSQDKQSLKNALQNRLNQLIGKVKTFGPSLWNEDLYEGGLVNRNDQFWNSKKTDYLFLEQFIVDDYADPLLLLHRIPQHKKLIVTNFRAARDPYTLFGEKVFQYFLKKKGQQATSSQTAGNGNKVADELWKYYLQYSKLRPNVLYRTARYIEFWNSFCSMLKSTDETKQSNVFFKLPYPGSFSSVPVPIIKAPERLFAPEVSGDNDSNKDMDSKIAKLFYEFIFTEEEISKLKGWKNGSGESGSSSNGEFMEYLTQVSQVDAAQTICPENSKAALEKAHHPALEHATIPGSNPVSEGTQKDLMVYLAQVAVSLKNVQAEQDFQSDDRKEFIKEGFTNAVEIAKNYRERIKAIREYFKEVSIVDKSFDPEKRCFKRTDSKTVAMISYPPSQLGAGNATIQTVSKFPFLYTEIGLKEVLPSDFQIASQASTQVVKAEDKDDIFGVDDNGWWWRLGDSNFSSKGLEKFKSTADSLFFLATEDDWNVLNTGDNPKTDSLKVLLKNGQESSPTAPPDKFVFSNYHLWNEGLRSPIALNLLLDELVSKLTKQFSVNLNDNGSSGSSSSSSSSGAGGQNCGSATASAPSNGSSKKEKYCKAMDWGDYWTKQFVKSQAKK